MRGRNLFGTRVSARIAPTFVAVESSIILAQILCDYGAIPVLAGGCDASPLLLMRRALTPLHAAPTLAYRVQFPAGDSSTSRTMPQFGNLSLTKSAPKSL